MPPIYDYFCAKCDKDYEVIKSIKEYDAKDPCPACGKIGRRHITKVIFFGEKVENAEFNVGLGKVVKNKKHREELAKQLNLVEIGNENPNNIHKTFDKDRKDKIKKSWDEV